MYNTPSAYGQLPSALTLRLRDYFQELTQFETTFVKAYLFTLLNYNIHFFRYSAFLLMNYFDRGYQAAESEVKKSFLITKADLEDILSSYLGIVEEVRAVFWHE